MKYISVIIPVYNAKTTIDRAITSVYRQGIDDFKIILIDDGSTDGSAEICDRWDAKDKRILTVHLQKNQGLPNARNVGLDNIVDDGYVFFLDSDDEIPDNAFYRLLSASVNTSYDIIIGSYVEIDTVNGIKTNKITEEKYCGEYSGDRLRENFIARWLSNNPLIIFKCLQSCLYSTEFIKRHGLKFVVKQKFGEDAKFMIESYCLAKTIYVTNVISYFYYYNSSVVSMKYYDKYRDSTIEYYKYNNDIIKKFLGGRKEYYCYLIGSTYVGINSYLLCANNRNTKRKAIYSFLYNSKMFKVLLAMIFMRKKNLVYANISRKDKLVAILYLIGLYKRGLKLLG